MSEAVPWHLRLSDRQRTFCEFFSQNGGNALQAARDAGYKFPEAESVRLMKKPGIRQALESLRASTTNAAIMTREERQQMWSEIARAKDEATKDRLKASELLGKSQADFIERKEITGKDGAPLQAEIRVRFVGGDD